MIGQGSYDQASSTTAIGMPTGFNSAHCTIATQQAQIFMKDFIKFTQGGKQRDKINQLCIDCWKA